MVRTYTSGDLFEDLDGIPEEDELSRLVKYYPTYDVDHRLGLLQDIFDGKTHTEMLRNKLKSKGIVFPSGKSKGGHSTWVTTKVRKTVIRLLYLRNTEDRGLSRKEALKELYEKKRRGGPSFELTNDMIRKSTILPK